MTDIIERAEAALEGVTEGPWRRHDFGHPGEQEPSSIIVHAGKFDWNAINDGEFIVSTGGWDSPEDANAEFIAWARSGVPDLIAELKTAREENERLRGEYKRAAGPKDYWGQSTMTDIRTRLAEALYGGWVPSTVVYGSDEPVGFDSPWQWAKHVSDVLLSLPGIAIVDANDLRLILKDAGQNGISGSYSEWIMAHRRLSESACSDNVAEAD